jgi:putative thioredoxin
MEQLLEVVKRDRGFRDDAGRRKLLAVFEMAAAEPDLVSEYRHRLSTILY